MLNRFFVFFSDLIAEFDLALKNLAGDGSALGKK